MRGVAHLSYKKCESPWFFQCVTLNISTGTHGSGFISAEVEALSIGKEIYNNLLSEGTQIPNRTTESATLILEMVNEIVGLRLLDIVPTRTSKQSSRCIISNSPFDWTPCNDGSRNRGCGNNNERSWRGRGTTENHSCTEVGFGGKPKVWVEEWPAEI